jgi:lipid II:glycine glycyltransferase (peptidoglycan interpeptide bridge formation enzyme)
MIPANKNTCNSSSFSTAAHSSFLQSIGWGAWQESQGHKVIRYAIDNNNLQLTNLPTYQLTAQFILHPFPFGNFYLYCPYGPVFDYELRLPADMAGVMSYELLLDKLIKQIQKDFPKALFVRLEPQDPGFNLSGIRYKVVGTKNIQPASTIISDLTKTTDELLAAMHPKTRYGIKLAEKSGVVFRPVTTEEEKAETIKLLKNALEGRRLSSHSEKYYKDLMDFQDSKDLQIHTFGAFHEKDLLACAVTIDFEDTRTYLFGGHSENKKQMMASYKLHWEIMRDAKAKGLKYYDWFGAESSSGKIPGFVQFKIRFGGEKVVYHGAVDIVFKNWKYQLYKIFRIINRLI